MSDYWSPKEGQRQLFQLQCQHTGEIYDTVKDLMKAIQRSKILMNRHKIKIIINPIWSN